MKWPPEVFNAVLAAFPEYARGPVVSWYPREGDTLKLSAIRVGVVVALAAGWDLDHLEATMATQTLDWTRPGPNPPIQIRGRSRLSLILEDPAEVYLSPEVSSDADRSYCCLSCWMTTRVTIAQVDHQVGTQQTCLYSVNFTVHT